MVNTELSSMDPVLGNTYTLMGGPSHCVLNVVHHDNTPSTPFSRHFNNISVVKIAPCTIDTFSMVN